MKQIIKTLLSILKKGELLSNLNLKICTENQLSLLKEPYKILRKPKSTPSSKSMGARLGAKSLKKLRLETIKPRN